MSKYPPISSKVPHFLHGADYNPEQWIATPEIWDEDMRLMKLAGCNVVSIGIFSWVMLEPEEGHYNFTWLDTIMDKLAENGIYAILATPSASYPEWLAQKYTEVVRVSENRQRNFHFGRQSHCYASPIYRKKALDINRMLANRYKNHPALIAWHISNEYGGECHCELCQEKFRNFLKNKYKTLDNLNHEWWTTFWSHKFTDWSQIESPTAGSGKYMHGLALDWRRFVTYQTIDFYKNEIAPIREITPDIPVTTNFMGLYKDLDYSEFAKEVDVISWDSYPSWHNNGQSVAETAADVAFVHDLNRCLKGKPFMLMESTPSLVNWQSVNKLKRPGIHFLSSLQAVAHGSDTVQYFQWRKSRGGSEKFHGAVVDHCGHEHTRVFSEVSNLGENLKKLDEVIGTTVHSDVAIIFDWQNRWALEDAQALNRQKVQYETTCKSHYYPFWKRGISADIISEEQDFANYKLIVAPIMYMVRPSVAEKIESFVKNGGVLVLTYWSGIVNENDLCFRGGFPGHLRKVAGIWSEEIDSLYETDENILVPNENNCLNIHGSFKIKDFCDIIHAETAQVIATYGSDFYKGSPALTVNNYGKGQVYYLAAKTEDKFLDTFYEKLDSNLKLRKAIEAKLPEGVSAQARSGGTTDYVFLMNFNDEEKIIDTPVKSYDLLTGKAESDKIVLPEYGVKILKVER